MPHPISSTHVGNHKLEVPATPISQRNQSSPTSVITGSIGHSQTILKPKVLSFWLLYVMSPNNRKKKQLKYRHCQYEQLKPSQLRKVFDHRKNISCFTPPLRTSIRNDTVGKQPINHGHAHFYFAISQKTTAKTNISAKINAISATINTIHQRYTSQFGAPTYPFFQIVIVCVSAPPVPFWSHLHQKNTTRFLGLQRLFDFNT